MSERSKEETLARVDSSMDAAWAAESLDRLRKAALRKRWITVDDLWKVIDDFKGDQAKVGAIMRRAATKTKTRTRFLKPTPYRVYSERGNHDNIRLWESTIFLCGDEKMPELATQHVDPDMDLSGMAKIYEAAKDMHTAGMTVEEMDVLKEVIESVFSTP